MHVCYAYIRYNIGQRSVYIMISTMLEQQRTPVRVGGVGVGGVGVGGVGGVGSILKVEYISTQTLALHTCMYNNIGQICIHHGI